MNVKDEDSTAVLDALKSSLDDVTMHTPLARIVTAGRARRRRRLLIRSATGVAAATAIAFGVPALDHVSTPPAETHVRTVAFTLETHTDGSIHVTWDKDRYFRDHEGLERALGRAGFPVVIKEGEFCVGPQDDASLDRSGVGPGVDAVMKGEPRSDDRVSFIFTPSAMPAGKQLFIGYLSDSQLAVTHGHPGSVERLVSVGVPLTCTTQAPPSAPGRG